MVGKQAGGQNLVKWLHRRHRLSNEADLTPASFSERIFWTTFKTNPDDFIIVSADNGVAGIKPDKNFIDKRTAEYQKKGKTYNPGTDSTVPYQIVAFTTDGQQVDPELLRAPAEAGDDQGRDPRDPTVTRARMGKHNGKDIQNPYNVFNLLAEQIGHLKTVWTSGFENVQGATGKGSVERDKMKQRADMKTPTRLPEAAAIQKVFDRVRPILKTLGAQALGKIKNTMKRYNDGGNFDGARALARSGSNLQQFLIQIDTSGGVTLNHSADYDDTMGDFSRQIKKAIVDASGAQAGTPEYLDFLNAAATGSVLELKPILGSLRDNLIKLT
jgi:hypothetical protein